MREFLYRVVERLHGSGGAVRPLSRNKHFHTFAGEAGKALRIDRQLHFGFSVVNLNERYHNGSEEAIAKALVYLLLLLMYMAVVLYAVFVAQGVVEEKSNRVMEIMIGAVRPSQLLAGKIIGIGSLALSQMLLFIAAAALMLYIVGSHFAQTLAAQQPGGAGLSAASAATTSPPATAAPCIATAGKQLANGEDDGRPPPGGPR